MTAAGAKAGWKRTKCAARKIQQEDQQHQGDERAAHQQGGADVAQAIFDEIGRAVERRHVLDALRREDRLHVLERVFQTPRHLQRVAPYCPPAVIEASNPRTPHDQRVAKLRLRPVHHPGDITQTDTLALVLHDHYLAELLRRQALALGLKY